MNTDPQTGPETWTPKKDPDEKIWATDVHVLGEKVLKSVWKLDWLMTGFENRFREQALKTGLNQLVFPLIDSWIELLEKKILKILKISLTIKKTIFHIWS